MKFAIFLISLVLTATLQAKTIEIKMLNNGPAGMMSFDPAYVKAAVGDVVKFKAVDAAHSSSSRFLPAGANTWNGKLDEEVSVTLNKEGVYIYQCEPHLAMAMVGVIQVGAATNLSEAKAEMGAIAKAFVMNKDRLQKLMDKVQ